MLIANISMKFQISPLFYFSILVLFLSFCFLCANLEDVLFSPKLKTLISQKVEQ